MQVARNWREEKSNLRVGGKFQNGVYSVFLPFSDLLFVGAKISHFVSYYTKWQWGETQIGS